MLRCLSGVWWGAHPQSLKLVYNAMIRSVLDYGTFILEPGNKSAFKKLDLIQSKALRLVTGAMRSSPVNALQVECVDAPLQIRRQFLADKFLFRTIQDLNHPLVSKLQKLTDKITTSPYWTHKPIPSIVNSFRKYVSLTSPTHRSNRLPLFSYDYNSLIILPNICFESVDKSDLHANSNFIYFLDNNFPNSHHLYTDASKHSLTGCVGVGVYHSQFNIVQKIKFPPETSVFTGECYGLFKALEYILLMKLRKSVVISDSKSALQALNKFPFKSKIQFPLIFEIRSLMLRCMSINISVNFVWVPSHTGITGNNIADRLANEAVQCGDIFPYVNYCHDLVNLPKIYSQEAWSEVWNESKQSKGKFFAKIQETIPSKPWFCRKQFTLNKTETSILIRMRLGHTCTPAHLAKLKIINDASCECGADTGDLNHILFSCPLYDRTAFLDDLLSLQIPLPTSLLSLLYSFDSTIYKCIASFISFNNIKI